MKKKLKQLAVVAVGLMLVFGGCSKEKEDPVIKEETENDEEIEKITEESAEEIPEDLIEETDQELPLSIRIQTNHKTYYKEGSEEAYLYLQYCDVEVEGTEYYKLKSNLENWSMKRSEELRGQYEAFEGKQTNESTDVCSIYQTVTTARADSAIVSLLDDTCQYTSGEEYSMFYREGINFDSKTGKRLELEDIFYD